MFSDSSPTTHSAAEGAQLKTCHGPVVTASKLFEVGLAGLREACELIVTSACLNSFRSCFPPLLESHLAWMSLILLFPPLGSDLSAIYTMVIAPRWVVCLAVCPVGHLLGKQDEKKTRNESSNKYEPANGHIWPEHVIIIFVRKETAGRSKRTPDHALDRMLQSLLYFQVRSENTSLQPVSL